MILCDALLLSMPVLLIINNYVHLEEVSEMVLAEQTHNMRQTLRSVFVAIFLFLPRKEPYKI